MKVHILTEEQLRDYVDKRINAVIYADEEPPLHPLVEIPDNEDLIKIWPEFDSHKNFLRRNADRREGAGYILSKMRKPDSFFNLNNKIK